LSTSIGLKKKGYLGTSAFAVFAIVLMYSMYSEENVAGFLCTAGVFFIVASYTCIYLLCGKRKAWWALAAVALSQVLLLLSPAFEFFIRIFREVLPGAVEQPSSSPAEHFLHHFFGAGLMEELFKAIPLCICLLVAHRLRGALKEQFTIAEPLDGILLGAASAAGFMFFETMFQYVPSAIEHSGLAAGLALLLPRTMSGVFGHMAYSGYFGYAIGLAVMFPAQRWIILISGWLVAALAHAIWNTAGAFGVIGSLLAGGAAYVLLAAAILKARQISPTRHANFATQVLGGAAAVAPGTAGSPPSSRPAATSPPPASSNVHLVVSGRFLPVGRGQAWTAREIAGLIPAGSDGIVADVVPHPTVAGVNGLRNRSRQSWTVTLPGGAQQVIAPSRSIMVLVGARVHFGACDGEFR